MTFRKLIATAFVGTLAATAAGVSSDAHAEAPAPFGPIASPSFAWRPGTTIEIPPESGCSNNSDWFVMRGPNLASVKSIDVTPRIGAWERQLAIPAINTCAQGDTNCVQIFVKAMPKDAPGKRTVTLKHADGRTLTTTFDVVPNAGRCDYPHGKKW